MKHFISALLAILVLLPGSAMAKDTWREAETDHFLILSSGSERGLRKFASRLESFHQLLDRVTGVDSAQTDPMKVAVYLANDIYEVGRLAGESGRSGVAGFYVAGERGPIAIVPQSTRDGTFTNELVLFHEYSHHHMLQYMPAAYPAWYIEGFAELAATASFEVDQKVAYGKAADHRSYELGANLYNSISDLIDGSYLDDPKKRYRWTYGDAWLITHYLTFSDDRRGQLRDYLEAINRGVPFKEAAKVFGDLTELQREITVYGRGRGVPYRLVSLSGDEPEVSIRTIPAYEAELLRHELNFSRLSDLPQPGDLDEAEDGEESEDETQEDFQERLAEALEERDAWLAELGQFATRHPQQAAIWELLAASQCKAQHYADCRIAAARSLVIKPSNPRALASKATANLHLIGQTEPARREDVAVAAMNSIVSAVEKAPHDPVVLLSYYRSFGLVGLDPPESAINALMSASRMIPQETGVRLTLAQELIRRGRYRDARTILHPLYQAPHDRAAQKAARVLLGQIEEILSGTAN